MNKLDKQKLNKIFGTKTFDLLDKQKNELNDQINKFAQNNTFPSGISIQARIELFKKHLKELSEIRVDTYFEIIDKNILIHAELKKEIIDDLQNYINNYIKSRSNGLNSAMLSYGHNAGSSIITTQVASLNSILASVRTFAVDYLQQKIDIHNIDTQNSIKKKFLEEFEELEAHQNILISTIIEAHRSLPIGKRTEFLVTTDSSGTSMMHPSLPNNSLDVSTVDLKMLDSAEYIKIESNVNSNASFSFYPTSKGIKYYEYLKQNNIGTFQQIDNEVRNYLTNSNFPLIYPLAFAKWKEANNLLWQAENQINCSTIGHLCRESVQEFLDIIISKYNLANKYPDKAHTKNRFEGIINYNKGTLGKTLPKFIEAIADYWNCLIEIIQRQEHSGLKDGEELGFEDARRVVFHTAILFYEVNRIMK
jgi:hypothetical protein